MSVTRLDDRAGTSAAEVRPMVEPALGGLTTDLYEPCTIEAPRIAHKIQVMAPT